MAIRNPGPILGGINLPIRSTQIISKNLASGSATETSAISPINPYASFAIPAMIIHAVGTTGVAISTVIQDSTTMQWIKDSAPSSLSTYYAQIVELYEVPRSLQVISKSVDFGVSGNYDATITAVNTAKTAIFLASTITGFPVGVASTLMFDWYFVNSTTLRFRVLNNSSTGSRAITTYAVVIES